MKKVMLLFFVGALCGSPGWSGIHYISRTYAEGENASEAATMEIEGWVDGDNAKILFTSSGNPMMGSGSYLLTRDGGSTLFLVNPQEETYVEWDLDKMMGMAGSMMEGMGGIFEMSFSNPSVETLLTEDGGTIVGMSTTHTKYKTSYTTVMKIMGMKRTSTIVSVEDIWSTDEVGDAAFGVWQRKGPPKTGNSTLDELIATEMGKIKGWPLKTITESTTTTKKGKQSVSRTVMEVTSLARAKVPESTFEIPPGFQKIEMMIPGMMVAPSRDDDQQQEEQSGGRFKRFKKMMGKGGG